MNYPHQPQFPLTLEAAAPFVSLGGNIQTAADFRDAASSLVLEKTHVINLCASRSTFLAGFAAALAGRKTTLLPPSSAAAIVAETAAAYDACSIIDDHTMGSRVAASRGEAALVAPSEDFVALIGHTSGSTGAPSAHCKKWSSLRATTALNAAAIRRELPPGAGQPWIVATVPSQHMYGMELAVLLPLLGGFSIHAGQPLFPADVAQALGEVPAPRVLVSTPVHLRSLVQSGVSLPAVAAVVSATAPLSPGLARDVEDRFGTTLLEMFGSTETCVIATRRSAHERTWRPYPGITLEPSASGTRVSAPWLAGSTLLQDVLEVGAEGRFTVIGRNSDLVEVAGKRASIADLTRRVTGLPGVEDAFVLQADAPDALGVRRIAALVVAPGLTPGAILDLLRPLVDAAFLPRPLVLVEALPRSQVGKIPRSEALKMLRESAR
jgi:acyl-coenzyme A synthetase/AMP-(fatty) acid ligase